MRQHAKTILFSVTCYVLAASVTVCVLPALYYAVSRGNGEIATLSVPFLIRLASVSAPVLFLLYWFAYRRVMSAGYALWVLLFLSAIAKLALGVAFHQFGDEGQLPVVVEGGLPFSRWLAGSAVLAWGYHAVWKCPPIFAHLPDGFTSASAYVRLVGAGVMMVAALVFTRMYPRRLAVWLPMLSPLWLMFGGGYDEYYPFIAWVWMSALLLLYERRRQALPSWQAALYVAVCPLAYVGFAPLGLILFVWQVVMNPKRIVQLAIWTALFYVAGIRLFFEGGIAAYFTELYTNLNLGEMCTLWWRYKTHAASPTSIFFDVRYAVSMVHMAEIAFFLFFGCGWVVVPLGVFGVWWNRHAVARVGWPSLRALGPLFVVLLMQIHYLVFMIPKLGPSNDVDLFFSVYFTLAFVVGLVLDTRLTDESKAVSTRYLILSAAAGGSIPALLFNLLAG